jgi:3-hydroxy-9,10-secoandrosta-1,3,5(10)-triene-9,17-dione monooxygenase
VFLGAFIEGGDNASLKETLHVLVPRSDYAIDDVWDVMGLCGTGSNDVVVEDAFVPDHRALPQQRIIDGDCPGLTDGCAAIYRLPFATMFSYAITSAVVGISLGVLAAHAEYQTDRVRPGVGASVDDPFSLVAIGTAASEIESARLQLLDNVAEMHGYASAGEEIPLALRTRARRDQVSAARRSVAAADVLFHRSGGHALMRSNPIQRLWRDAHAGHNHAINVAEPPLASYASVRIGRGLTDFLV